LLQDSKRLSYLRSEALCCCGLNIVWLQGAKILFVYYKIMEIFGNEGNYDEKTEKSLVSDYPLSDIDGGSFITSV